MRRHRVGFDRQTKLGLGQHAAALPQAGPTIAVLLGGIRRIPQFFTVPDAIRVAARKFERDGSTLCVGSRSCLSRSTNTRHIGGIVAANPSASGRVAC